MNFTPEQSQRYARHFSLNEIGMQGQERLLNSNVLIIGAGGLGSPAALYLAAAGVGHIGIADADRVELSNLQRQIIHSMPALGMLKAESARESIIRLNADVNVTAYNEYINGKNIFEIIDSYDFVIDATDNFSSKFLINDSCVKARKPFCHGGIFRFQGQIMSYVPDCGPCYRCLFKNPPPDDAVLRGNAAGVLGAVAGVIGCLQAAEAIKYLTATGEMLTGKLLVYDALKAEFRKITVVRDKNCTVCG